MLSVSSYPEGGAGGLLAARGDCEPDDAQEALRGGRAARPDIRRRRQLRRDLPLQVSVYRELGKVATYHRVYRAEPKEPTQFGSVSGSEIQNLPFSYSGIVSLYRSEPKEPT